MPNIKITCSSFHKHEMVLKIYKMFPDLRQAGICEVLGQKGRLLPAYALFNCKSCFYTMINPSRNTCKVIQLEPILRNNFKIVISPPNDCWKMANLRSSQKIARVNNKKQWVGEKRNLRWKMSRNSGFSWHDWL